MFERVHRSDLPSWIDVLLSADSVRVQGRYVTPLRVGLVLGTFWCSFILCFVALFFLIAMSLLPFSPAWSIFWLTLLGFGFRYTLLDWVCDLASATLCVEFTRERRIVIRRSFGSDLVFQPKDTFQIAFGANIPDLLLQLQRHQRSSIVQTLQKDLLADARVIEFRFGAEQHVIATFSKRRRAEEFVVVCNWALGELKKLDDETFDSLPAA